MAKRSLTYASSTTRTTSRVWTLMAACFTIALLLLAGVPTVAASDSGSGTYVASSAAAECPPNVPVTTGAGGSFSMQASTASFGADYGTHIGLEVSITDDISPYATVTVCLYYGAGEAVVRFSGVNHVAIHGVVHDSFLAWVEPIEIEQGELTITYATTGQYAWESW